MYKYIIQQWCNKDKKWHVVGESNDKLCALENIRQCKNKDKNLFYRLLMVLEIC